MLYKKNRIMDTTHQDFYIKANIDGKEKQLKVVELQTTDGVPYYSCLIDEKEVTQIRKETYGKWEQLWGHLSAKTVNAIGEKILEKTTPS